MKRILCVLPQVTGGGAERFFLTFLHKIDRSKYEPVVALVRQGGGFDHEIPDDIKIHVLTAEGFSTKVLAALGTLRYTLALAKIIRATKPDAIVSFGSLLNGTVALAAHRIKYPYPVVLIEAIHESSEILHHSGLEKLSRTLFLRWTYPLATGIVAVSEDVATDLRTNFNIKQGLHVIHYGIDLEQIRLLAKEPVNHPWLCTPRQGSVIVACGRLVSQKGFSVLISAISKVSDDVKLILIGDGEGKLSLERQIQQLGLHKRVDLVGYDRNPYRYIAKADIFVMPSLWEGLPIVLLEALALGIPIIASNCPTGPRITLNEGKCGILVPPRDCNALSKSIKRLLSDNKLQKQLCFAAQNRAEDFSAQKSVNSYLNLLSKLGNWQ